MEGARERREKNGGLYSRGWRSAWMYAVVSVCLIGDRVGKACGCGSVNGDGEMLRFCFFLLGKGKEKIGRERNGNGGENGLASSRTWACMFIPERKRKRERKRERAQSRRTLETIVPEDSSLRPSCVSVSIALFPLGSLL
jgi:hypothetical protein